MAMGRECQVRVPGVCNFDPETTVLAHVGGAGMGRKAHDLHGAWCCSACHDFVDGRRGLIGNAAERKLYLLEGVLRTQNLLIAEGVISVTR